MRIRVFSMLVLVLALSLSAISARADIFGAAASYAVLATTAVTNPATPLALTTVTGDMGAVSCDGFVLGTGCSLGFGTVSGATNLNNAAYTTALAASNTAYNTLAATPFDFTFTCLGTGVGCSNNLAPGVYFSSLSSTLLNGTLTLNGGGDPNALWIFETAFGLTTGSGSSVVVTGAGQGAGLYWEVGSQATLGDNTSFQGNILAGTEVAFDPGAQDTCGRAFTDTAAGTAVTFAGNNPATATGVPNEVGFGNCSASTSGYNGGVITTLPGGGTGVGPGSGVTTAVPEPSSVALWGLGMLGLILVVRRKVVPQGSACGGELA